LFYYFKINNVALQKPYLAFFPLSQSFTLFKKQIVICSVCWLAVLSTNNSKFVENACREGAKVPRNARAIIICLTSVLPAAYKKNRGTSRGKCTTIVSSNVNVMDFLPAGRCSILIDVLLLYVRNSPPRAHLTTIQHNKHSLLAIAQLSTKSACGHLSTQPITDCSV